MDCVWNEAKMLVSVPWGERTRVGRGWRECLEARAVFTREGGYPGPDFSRNRLMSDVYINVSFSTRCGRVYVSVFIGSLNCPPTFSKLSFG